MKNIIIILFTFFSLSATAQNILGKVHYIKKMNSDSVKDSAKTKKVEKYLKFVNRINNNLKKVKYILSFKNYESNFFAQDRMNIDSNPYLRLATNLGGGRGLFYTNLKTNQVLQQANGFGDFFLITSKIDSFNWIITKEEKILQNKKCYKAILVSAKNGDFKTYAWFSPDLPFNFGPIGYSNLPGLILELHLNNGFSFYATKIDLNKEKVKIKKPIKGKKVTKEEFEGIGKKTMSRYRGN